jgi:hypothetical protein
VKNDYGTEYETRARNGLEEPLKKNVRTDSEIPFMLYGMIIPPGLVRWLR